MTDEKRVKWKCINCGRILECNGKCFKYKDPTLHGMKPFECKHVCHYCIFAEPDQGKVNQISKVDFCERRLIKNKGINPSYRWKDVRCVQALEENRTRI